MKSIIVVVQHLKAFQGGKPSFTVKDMDDFLKTQLFYLDKKLREEEREKILKEATRIQFIEHKGSDKYVVKSEYTGASMHEKLLKRLWISYKIRETFEKKLDDFKLTLQREIRTKFDKRPSMERYFN
jgi:hypothetical protein